MPEENKDEKKTIEMRELIHPNEAMELFKYLNENGHGPNSRNLHSGIVDWLGTQPAILERMNKHGYLLSYFAYVMELALHESQGKKGK